MRSVTHTTNTIRADVSAADTLAAASLHSVQYNGQRRVLSVVLLVHEIFLRTANNCRPMIPQAPVDTETQRSTELDKQIAAFE